MGDAGFHIEGEGGRAFCQTEPVEGEVCKMRKGLDIAMENFEVVGRGIRIEGPGFHLDVEGGDSAPEFRG